MVHQCHQSTKENSDLDVQENSYEQKIIDHDHQHQQQEIQSFPKMQQIHFAQQ